MKPPCSSQRHKDSPPVDSTGAPRSHPTQRISYGPASQELCSSGSQAIRGTLQQRIPSRPGRDEHLASWHDSSSGYGPQLGSAATAAAKPKAGNTRSPGQRKLLGALPATLTNAAHLVLSSSGVRCALRFASSRPPSSDCASAGTQLDPPGGDAASQGSCPARGQGADPPHWAFSGRPKAQVWLIPYRTEGWARCARPKHKMMGPLRMSLPQNCRVQEHYPNDK